ncbi:tryptophan synthetase, variant 2 [Salvia divinorum]|uniref:Tryptophan synthetase, variant 2 n=1 Tax=Salvia divinorum TaxID=28513 RepID=A0ABD1GLX9_SALDI
MSSQRTTSESKALVPAPSAKQDALAVVSVRKSKRSESTQRRIRKPFTVAEAEALVQAVEKLGTGRWRDVKLRAFDNAKHRTYVDLKVKLVTVVSLYFLCTTYMMLYIGRMSSAASLPMAYNEVVVQLRDKWKTLVHTAGISPQQRRGEPVPQELLDRVLTAHAYWSQHQPKQQQLKSQPDTCLLL